MVLLFPIVSCNTDNKLTKSEQKDGWVLLFDGKTTTGWHNWNEDIISGWLVEDGCLVGQGLGGVRSACRIMAARSGSETLR